MVCDKPVFLYTLAIYSGRGQWVIYWLVVAGQQANDSPFPCLLRCLPCLFRRPQVVKPKGHTCSTSSNLCCSRIWLIQKLITRGGGGGACNDMKVKSFSLVKGEILQVLIKGSATPHIDNYFYGEISTSFKAEVRAVGNHVPQRKKKKSVRKLGKI